MKSKTLYLKGKNKSLKHKTNFNEKEMKVVPCTNKNTLIETFNIYISDFIVRNI